MKEETANFLDGSSSSAAPDEISEDPADEISEDPGDEISEDPGGERGEITSGSELSRLLRDAGPEALRDLLRQRGEELTVEEARQALRNPFVDEALVRALVERRSLLSSYELRRDLAAHPSTPRVIASRFLGGLYWGDLLKLSLSLRVPPAVRVLAERELVQRLPGLALGEKVSLARRGARPVLHQLRKESHFRVIAALLQNPRLTVDIVQPLAGDLQAPPEILRQLAEHPRWGVRYPVRLALCRNPRTPPQVALRLLPMLKKVDLKGLASDRRISSVLRRRAARLLSSTPPRGTGSLGGS
ncbi:MAG: hypothetical protein AAGD01_18590 [Acidobacteriota bacterium]